jgi:hypothetical protein
MGNKTKKELRQLLNEKRRDKRTIYKKTKKVLVGQGEFFFTNSEAYFYHSKKKKLFFIDSNDGKDFHQYLASELYFDRSDGLFKGVLNPTTLLDYH